MPHLDPAVSRRALGEFRIHELLREMSVGALSSRSQDLVSALGGEVKDRHTVDVPLYAMRDLSAGSAPGGGYLVATDTRATADALAQMSAVAAAGATIVVGLKGAASIPRISASGAAYWLATETAEITASQPTLASVSMAPKNAGAYTAFSRQLALQSPDLAAALERDMRTTVGALIDAAAVNGDGTGGAPTGILNTSGIGSQSGTSLSWSGILGMRAAVRVAGGQERTTGWICAPDTAELLGQRTREASDAGAGYIFDNGKCDGRPVYVSANVPAATLILADWRAVTLGFWSGLQFEVNPYASFQTGGASARLTVSLDVAVTHPAAIVAAESIT